MLNVIVEQFEVCATIDDAIRRFASDALDFDDSVDVALTTTFSSMKRRKLGSLSATSLEKVFNPDEALIVNAAVAPSQLLIRAGRSSPSGERFLVSFSVAKSGGTLADLDKLIDSAREFAKTVEVVSGGIDLGLYFDWQNDVLFPLVRSGNWPEWFERGLCCGYYWLTLIGPSLRSKLDKFPEELDAIVVDGPDLLEVRLCDDPSDDERVAELLPSVRSWLRPVRSGWYVSGRLSTDLRSYEGPMVPYGQAHCIRKLYEGGIDPLDPSRLETLKDEFDLDLPTAGDVEVEVEFALLDEKFREFAEQGVLGAIDALARGIDEGWLDFGSLTSCQVTGLKVTAKGSAKAVRALLIVADSLNNEFGAPVRDPANVVSIESVSVRPAG